MTKLEKRLEKLEQSPQNISRKELINLLVSLGFEHKPGSGKGSHVCYKHPKLPDVKLTIPKRLLPTYIKQVRNAINRLREIEENG